MLAVALLLVPAGSGEAQTLEDLQRLSIEQLSQIQITSVAKRSESLSDAPAAIYVITHDQIMRSGATTVPEILRLAPNLEVAQIGSTSYAISARGFNVGDNASLSNKLLVLIDGRSVYSPMFGGVYWDMINVLPENIERIEVISGPGAALWGANAVNGVINIITYSSNQTQGGLLTLGGGNLEHDAGVQYGGRLSPDLTYQVHAEYSDFSSYPEAGGGSARDGWWKPTGGFRLDWDPSADHVSVQGDVFTATEDPNGFIRGQDVAATWRHTFDNGSSLQLLAYYDDSQRWLQNAGGFTVNTYDVELQHDFKLAGWNEIVWGAGDRAFGYHFYQSGGLLLVPDAQTLNLADWFAQDTISLARALKLTLGLKLEDEPYAGVQAMPDLRIAWKPIDSTLLWAAVSRAVRSPTPVDTNLREYAGPIDVLNGSNGFHPETLTAYQVGTRVTPTASVSFSVSGFYDVYDRLRSVEAPPSPAVFPFTFGNLMAGTVFGVEVWGTWQVNAWWQLSAGFNLQHENLTFLPGSTEVLGLAFVADDPGHQANLHSAVNFGHGVTWDAYLRDSGELPHPVVAEYVELDTSVAWQVTPRLQVSLSGFNLLHRYHVEFLEDGESTEIPRSVLARARIRF